MRKLFRRGFVCFPMFLFAFPLWAQVRTESIQGQEAVANEVLVKFQTAGLAAIPQVELAEDVDVVEAVGSGDVFLLHSRSKSASTMVSELASRPDLAYVEPNYLVYAVAIPNDPRFGELWGLRNTGQTIQGFSGTAGADISASSAWDVSTGSRANVVTVVDTGIDYTHPDLSANVWSAPATFSVNIG